MPTSVRRSLAVAGPFSLARTAAFEFGPHDSAAFGGTYRTSFVVDGYTASAAAAVTQRAPDELVVDLVCTAPAAVDAAVAQLARFLSVDVDARPFVALAAADHVLGPLVRAAPGLRPPLFASAYEALAWAVLSARRPRAQMSAVRAALAERAGERLVLPDGTSLPAFPRPEALLGVDAHPGLDPTKIRRLHGVATAALEGRLDTNTLRAMPPADAATVARSLDGVGPFYADLVVVRALGHTDLLPRDEPRVRARLAVLLGRAEAPGPEEFAALAEPWRPWRTWACVYVRAVDPAPDVPEGPRAVPSRV